MILLITGASHTGKTLLAQRMLEKYKYPYLSIDHLKMGLIRSGNTALTPEDDEELVGYLWPIVREIIKTAIENKQDLIVEGCYVPFDWRGDFDEGYLSAIRFICLAMSDDYIDSHFAEIKEHASDVETRPDDSWCTAQQLKQDNCRVIEGFRKAGEPVMLITGEYEETLKDVLAAIETGMTDDFGIKEMQDMQKALQEKYKDRWKPIGPERGKDQLLWMLGEVGKVIDIIKKHGVEAAGRDPALRAHLTEELSDVLMYYNDVLLCCGISAEELKRAYSDKFEKNMKRW